MRETTSGGSGSEMLPDGAYEFTVVGVPRKKELAGGKFMRIWKLSFDGQEKDLFLFPNQYYNFLEAIGGKKVGKDMDWEDSDVDGRTFSCNLRTVKSKDGKYSNYVFENCEPVIPF